MNSKADFYLKRRSVIVKKMGSEPIKKKDLEIILSAGIRVPDHGSLNPWKLIVIEGKSLSQVDKKIILPEYKKKYPEANKASIDLEANRFQRAGAVIAVMSTPVEHPTIPKWEMHLSSGAVCMNLLSCAQLIGYASQWLTEWYSYNDKMLEFLGGNINKDKISGFIYIGHKTEEPLERKRPDPFDVVSFF